MDYLIHHGVKGMKWGVWNEETAAKYTLKKGSNIRRFTSANEVQNGTDLSRRFYASQNQHDFELYRNAVDTLPSTYIRKKAPSKFNRLLNPLAESKITNQKIGLITYEAIDDVHVAKGKAVLDSIMKDYGTTKLSDIFDEYGLGYDRRSLDLDENATVKSVYTNKKLSEVQRNAVGRRLVSSILGATEDDDRVGLRKNGKWEFVSAPGKKVFEDLKKSGYDAVEDIEDQLSPDASFKPKSPLIVINGSKFKVSESKLIDRDKYDPKINR